MTGRAHRKRVTRDDRPGRLPAEDLAEPPPIVRRPGQAERLSEVRPGRLRIGEGGDVAAGDERASQQGRVVNVARDRQRLFGLVQGVDAAHPCIEDSLIREGPSAHRGRHLGVLRVEVGQRGVEPGPPFPDAAPRLPQRLQRRRQRQRQLGIGVFPAPPKGGAQVVDLDVGLLETLLIITACRRVEQGRQRRVVVAVT